MKNNEDIRSNNNSFTCCLENDRVRKEILLTDICRNETYGSEKEMKENEESKENIKNNKNIEIKKKNMSVIQIHKFINKLKNTSITELEKNHLKLLQEDIKRLNISKYIGEILSYIFDLCYHVNKYSEIYLLIHIIKYIYETYKNVNEHIEKIIFLKFFKLEENDKNFFFIIFHDLYNNINDKENKYGINRTTKKGR